MSIVCVTYTVPLKCKLPSLVLFLARRVSFLARQFSAELDDSNAEIAQIYGKSVLSKFSRCAVNIYLIFDREKFALCTRWRDKRESPLKFHGTASFEKYSISLVLFGRIG